MIPNKMEITNKLESIVFPFGTKKRPQKVNPRVNEKTVMVKRPNQVNKINGICYFLKT
ncbi:hypothetical protein AERO8C_70125 [Aeromonas veronii]|uniref:Uncharacterized protein n=1 Tax=Aeromonas veronii TaxID=654 RepID=A0A653LBH6_AERVE|nr:hypothetical protein AERO8C_70125 [Aeromonas veronii]